MSKQGRNLSINNRFDNFDTALQDILLVARTTEIDLKISSCISELVLKCNHSSNSVLVHPKRPCTLSQGPEGGKGI